jgi:hypothetical protein
VNAVIAWHMPASYGWETETALTDIDWASAARKTLETAVREALDPADTERVHEHVVEEHRQNCWSTAVETPISWSWAASVVALSPARSSGRWASTWWPMRRLSRPGRARRPAAAIADRDE